MKKFIQHIIYFIIPLIVVGCAFIFSPTDKKRAYHYLTEDCEGRGAWIYHRIFESKQPIDLAFLGSSHTINGVNDSLIDQQLALRNSNIKYTCNLGYCRLGRDLTYVLMKQIQEEKKTKVFIIEVLPDEPQLSHPIFPFVAEMKDVVQPKTIFNRSYFNNLYSTVVARLMYARQNLYNEPYPDKYRLHGDFGFSTNTFLADSNVLNEKKQKRYKNAYKSHTWTRSINLPFPRAWLANIKALSNKNNLKIVFLYIPSFGSPEKEPIEKNTYEKYGPLWIAPDSIFSNKQNWYDHEHLNIKGAKSFSIWLAEKISKTDFR